MPLPPGVTACACCRWWALASCGSSPIHGCSWSPRHWLAPRPFWQQLSADGVELLPLGGEWPLLEPLCLQHGLVGNAIADGWIAAAVLARRECLATFDRDFVPLLPARQLVLLNP